jgi:predicted acetyltransferase
LKQGVPTVTVSKAKNLPLIDIRGLAALYSGRVSADQARAMGLLTGPADQDALFAAAFAGASPWMPDFF